MSVSEDNNDNDHVVFHDGRNRYERAFYLCQCDRLRLCCPTVRKSYWSGGRSSGVRQSYDMKTKQRWIFMVFLLCALFVLLLLWTGGSGRRKGLTMHIDLEELTERNKCPACFGVNLCPQIVTGKIKLSDWTKYAVTRLVNQKNVFYADWMWRGKETKVILKKLAHDHELDALDKTICDRDGKTHNCEVSTSVRYLIDEYMHHSEIHPGEEILHGGKIGKGSDILLCPSHRKMDFLISAAKKFNRGQNSKTILANVLTTILVNPEPLILEAFPSSDGWPFPQYHGSCGRIVVEEYVGRSLSQYINEPFRIRAYLAKQLLDMANKFGENPNNFVLYITDPSPDNFAVNEDTHSLKLIDLENLIIVDKEDLIMSKVEDADKLLVGQSMKCEKHGSATKCFSFSTEDLCTRPLTDHNYYAVCAGILAPNPLTSEFPQGLLHSVPQSDKEKIPQLEELLQQCKDPSNGSLGFNRIQAAQKLIKILNDYLA